MKRTNKVLLLLCAFFTLTASSLFAAAGDVVWKVKAKALGDNNFELLFDASIDKGWHMYDLGPYDDMGPNATQLDFVELSGVVLEGGAYLVEGEVVRYFDDIFEMEIGYIENHAVIGQKVRLTAEKAVLKGAVEWMVCNDTGCMPLTDWEFFVELEADSPSTLHAGGQSNADTLYNEGDTSKGAEIKSEVEHKSMSSLIIEAIMWGLLALFTPCVFPMVPMTVSYFMKGSENVARGRFRAGMYGLFIVLLYTVPIGLIIMITRWVGGDAVTADIFNWLSTHWLPNILFFLVFMVFAASFFGAFEIVLPSKWTNKTDSKADKKGLGGVFFMALTLVLVSFSCTGPIVGSVLIKSTQGEFWQPIATMLVFSITFALPFVLFALFPSLLNKVPKSGGWLNSVKVVLGFIEVALGLKFLSVADQTYHWGILDREIYLAIWIAVFTLMGLYLLGKLRFKHDSELKFLSVPRLALAILTFSFVVYLIPGMWGAPLKGISGYLPPITTQDFVMGTNSAAATDAGNKTVIGYTSEGEKIKYADMLKLPHNINGFFDYTQGTEYARRVGKPVFIDFTGHGCVNCREMEARVWADSEVLSMLKNDYVVIALYSDDKKNADEKDWITTPTGRVLKGIGKINSYLATSRFGVNAQPAYVLLNDKGEMMVPPRGYNLDVPQFVEFLRTGLAEYAKSR